jgi:hypothetical protein
MNESSRLRYVKGPALDIINVLRRVDVIPRPKTILRTNVCHEHQQLSTRAGDCNRAAHPCYSISLSFLLLTDDNPAIHRNALASSNLGGMQ